jgi:hypothetical protein
MRQRMFSTPALAISSSPFWRALSIGLAVSMLTACASRTKPLPVLPADLVQPCPDLAPLTDSSAGALLQKLTDVSESYYDCQRKHSALVKAITP